MSIRVLIADDHEVVRRGLQSLLDGTDIEVIAEASNGTEAVDKSLELNPDVVLMDIRMPESDGLTALKRIRSELPDTQVVVLSTYDNPTYIARAITLGASDYLLKGTTRERLVESISASATGRVTRRSDELRKVVVTMRTTSILADDENRLTQRETQVLRHVALGLSNKEIALSLNVSVETVKEHVQNLLRKINVSDRTQAAVWAVREGLV